MRLTLSTILAVTTLVAAASAPVRVRVSGLEESAAATVSIASYEYLATIQVTQNGEYTFADVPSGAHSVKVEASGYNSSPSIAVNVTDDGAVIPSEPIRLVVTRQSDNPDEWTFKWEEDGSPAGYTQTSHINKPAEIEFLGKKIVPADVPSFNILEKDYHVILANDEKEWTHEYAYRLLETLKTIPVDYCNYKIAKFTLTSSHLADDITVNDLGDGYEVIISEDAFYYANPFLVSLDGVRGRLFSKRLHHALVNFLTDFGKRTDKAHNILVTRYGCQILDVDYESLTKGITDEDASHFQQFHPTELVSIINMLEELPEGFHQTPHLNYLIRRCDGHPHPTYPDAAAVSWCVDNGYIEFMESAFGGNDLDFNTLRLILHEKSHFLWAYTFSDDIRNNWIETGGWYEDPDGADGWSTTKDVEFVSAYAHAHNPNEDMAESIAYYLKDPDMLLSRSPEKYNFIRDYIMHGTRYISTVPDHLSFEVLNLYPDYDYPGKIKRVDVKVEGSPESDKILNLEIELNHVDGYSDGASYAITRVTSPEFFDADGNIHHQYVDLHLNPIPDCDHILRGSIEIPKYSKSGNWRPGDIIISDMQGNQRFEGRNDCVVEIYVNNPLEDLILPVYEDNSLNYELSDIEVEGHHCQNLKVTFKAQDNVAIASTFARIYAESENFDGGGTSLTDQYGTYNPETHIAEINFLIPDYFPTADYYVPLIHIEDKAKNKNRINFYSDEVKKIHITTPNPDYTHPEIDLNRMYVYAEPTHPEAPDGETKVTITFYARDNISGAGRIAYWFIDPQGIRQGNYWYYHRNSYTTFFDGDPTAWERHQIVHILPQGSVPGRWGLEQMMIKDKAGNERYYNFVETLIFEPDDDLSEYELFAEIEDETLLFGINGSEGMNYSFNWRIIHEESGMEINNRSASYLRMYTSDAREGNLVRADISAFPKGDLILITEILGEDGNPVSVKSKRLNYAGVKIKAESLSLSPYDWQGNVGKSFYITPTILPEETTDKTLIWKSSDESVATVDASGQVYIRQMGMCTITASTVDGSDLTAECSILSGLTGIETIFSEGITTVDVYNLQGTLQKRGCNQAELLQLSHGFYIVKTAKDSKIIIVK